MRQIVLALAPACLMVLAVSAQAAETPRILSDYSVASWSEEDGLPSGRIWSIAQDKEGYLWLGTEGGLVRFDGVRFQRWTGTADAALPNAAIVEIRAARDGSLWIGYDDTGGVSRIRHHQVRHYDTSAGLTEGRIYFLLEDSAGTMWAGNRDGLYRFDGDRWERLGEDSGLPAVPIRAAYEDGTGTFWLGTAMGIFQRRRDSGKFHWAYPDHQSLWFSADAQGRIWSTSGTEGFSALGTAQHGGKTSRPGNGVRVMHDRGGNLWVATQGQGLWRVALDSSGQVSRVDTMTIDDGLSSDTVRSLFEDRLGNIWVGTLVGLHRFTPHKVSPVRSPGVSRTVQATADGRIWVGTTAGLVEFTATRQKVWGWREGLPSSNVSALSAAADGSLWISSGRRIARVVNGRLLLPPWPEDPLLYRIASLAVDSQQNVWLCDIDQGLFRWSEGRITNIAPPPEVRNRRPALVYADRNGRVWLALTGGYLTVVSENGRLYGPSDGLGGTIMAIHEGPTGTVWIGGTHGLSRFADGLLRTVTWRNGLPGNAVSAVVEDSDGYLWLGVNTGIIRLSRGDFDKAVEQPSFRIPYELYDRSDGLLGVPTWLGYSPVATRGPDGRLWFLSGGGVTVLDPVSLRANPVPATMRIEGYAVQDQQHQPTPDAILPPRLTGLTIDYTALHVTSPTKVRFRYRLEGLDDTWVEAGTRRRAVYRFLPPGQYRFHVVASSSEGRWNESTAVWDFSVTPTFYQTRWFYASCILLLTAAIWAAWRRHVKQVRRQFSAVLAERARLSREIHDTLLQGLFGVSLEIDTLAHEPDSPGPVKQRLALVERRVQDYLRDARESIWELRASTLERRELASALREVGERAAAGKVPFKFTMQGTPHRCSPAVEQHLLRIGQEAVVNAVRHADANKIELNLEYQPETLRLSVLDDGRGFDPDSATREVDGHYGLVSMRERAEEAGARFRIETSIGNGTLVEVAVPLTAK